MELNHEKSQFKTTGLYVSKGNKDAKASEPDPWNPPLLPKFSTWLSVKRKENS